MADEPLTHPYSPPAALGALYRRVFEQIQVEPGWAEQVRALAAEGSVLYVLPNLNWLDFLALDYLTKRHDLPPVRYSNDLGLWLLNPKGPNVTGAGLKGYGLWNMLVPSHRKNPEAQLRDALAQGGSAALFLKRPPSVLDAVAGARGGRGMREGDQLVRELFRLQRAGGKSLILLPLCFLWSKTPDRVAMRPWDFVIGSQAWPTPTRALGQFAYNMRHAALRWGEPVRLAEMLDESQTVGDEVLLRRIVYMLLRRIERERRAIVGPAGKAPERVRTEILRSPKLRSVVSEMAGGDPARIAEKREEALAMLEELQATPQPDVTKWMGLGLDWAFNRIYRGIEYDPAEIDRVREAARDGTLILLPSHKSHIDYLVLSYFFYERNVPLPAIAAGDNLNFKPVGPIFRRCGAFFIRRSFKGDRLYAAVVDAYIRRLIRDGYPIELFLEGGRSRTGKLLEPKFGLLNMIVDAVLSVPSQRVSFLPVSIGYERVVEADSYQRELSGAEKKKEEATDLLSASEVLRHRYGRINLQFGQLLTLDDIRQDLGIPAEQLDRPAKRRALVTRLGNRVMDEINRVTAVSPGALVALTVLASESRTLTERTILEDSARLLHVLRRLGVRQTRALVLLDGSLRRQAIREALHMFVDAQLLERLPHAPGSERRMAREGAALESGGALYGIVDAKRLQLDTSKNLIVHFFVERGLLASAFDRDALGHFLPTERAVLAERVLVASRLFKHEFRFRADATFDEIFAEAVDVMLSEGHLRAEGELLRPGPGEEGWDGDRWLGQYRAMVATFFEGYLVAAESLELLLDEPKSEKELVKAALARGHQAYVAGRISRREAVSKPLVTNGLHALTELGYLRSREGKLELAEAFQSREALSEPSDLIAAFLSGSHEVRG